MNIESIKMQNFRQYRNVEIGFSISDEKNFNIIQGITGAGKTNLLNAITWCLYGKEKHIDEKSKGYSIVNNLSIRELKENGKCKVGIQLQFRDEEGKKVIIGRSREFKKLENGRIMEINDMSGKSYDGSTIIMLVLIGKDFVEVPDPELQINRMIPESIEEYFFFDGERLNDYFLENSGKRILEAVFKISQIGLISNALKHLENKKRELLREEKNLSPNTINIRDELDEKYIKKDEYESILKNFKDQKGKAEDKIKEFGDKLRTVPISNINQLQSEREKTEEILYKLDEELSDLKKEKLKYLIGIFPFIYAFEAINNTKQMLNNLETAGEIPPDIKKQFLLKLLQTGNCICGTDISKDNIYREKVKELFVKCDDITQITSELISEHISLSSIIKEVNNFNKEHFNYNKKINGLEEKIKNENEQLKKINDQFKIIDVEEIKNWNNKMYEYRELKENYIGQIAVCKQQVDTNNKDIKRLEEIIEKELKKEEKFKKIQKKMDFYHKSLDAFNNIKNNIMEEVRKEIEEKTKQQFLELIWKKDTYRNIKINENYEISITDKYGEGGIGTLSAGETQILALSFISALNSVSGFNMPIIIDTPLGRIAKEPGINIASNLPKFFKGKQVTLLVTDTEYSIEVREKLLDKIGKEYLINFKELENGSEAEVVSYGTKNSG